MNRQDLHDLMDDVMRELTMKGGHFDALYGLDEKTLEQARFISAVALTAADRYYSRLTDDAFRLRELDEHPGKEQV